MRVAVMLLLASTALVAQESAPNAARQRAILERMKDAAINYADRLQDFLCVETIERSKREGLIKRWQALDTQEREAAYADHLEHYRALTVNGKPASDSNKIKPGYFLGGSEFGPALGYIFDPKNAAQFEWERVENSGSQRLCVFRYRVTTKEGTMAMQADQDRIALQHHGMVFSDCENGLPMRIRIETEPATLVRPNAKIAIGWNIDIRYAMTEIAGKQFLLPQTAAEWSRFGGTQVRLAIGFRGYRKYEASSAVTFDTEK